MLENKHSFTEFRMMAEVNNPQHLNVFENVYIYKAKRVNNKKQNSMDISSYEFRMYLYSEL